MSGTISYRGALSAVRLALSLCILLTVERVLTATIRTLQRLRDPALSRSVSIELNPRDHPTLGPVAIPSNRILDENVRSKRFLYPRRQRTRRLLGL